MAIDFATETTLRALSPALTPLSTEATQQQIVSAITSASGGVQLVSKSQIDDVTSTNVHTSNKELRVFSEGHVSDNNSSTANLGGGGVFTGVWEDTLDYSELIVSVYADRNSATNGLDIQWSSDALTVEEHDYFTYTNSTGKTWTFPCNRRYFRLVYTNGATPQGDFNLSCLLKRFASKGSSHRLKDALNEEDDAIVTKSEIVGFSTAGGGTLQNVKVNPSGALTVESTIAGIDSGVSIPVDPIVGQLGVQGGSGVVTANTQRVVLATDVPLPAGTNAIGLVDFDPYMKSAFGELRVSTPRTLVDIVNKYGRDPEFTSTSVSGGGAVTDITAESAFRLAVGATNGDFAKVRTHDWFRYQSGRGQRIILTCIHSDSGQTNQIRNWGYFDNDDGLMFRLSGTTIQLVRRTSTGESGGSVGSPYEQVVPQASWNVNTYNSLDVTKGNIYEIGFQWLGVGVVSFWINGILVHRMSHPGVLTYPYMATWTLPLTWEVINTGASSAAHMKVICGHVTSQSGQDAPRIPYSVVGAQFTTSAGAEVPLISFRMKQTLNGVDNRVAVYPGAVNVDNQATTAGANAIVYVRLDPTLTGATWAGVVSSQSAMEYDSAATATSGGELIDKFIVPAIESVTSQAVENIYKTATVRFGRDAYTGTADIISISVQRLSSNNVIVTPAFFWGEER